VFTGSLDDDSDEEFLTQKVALVLDESILEVCPTIWDAPNRKSEVAAHLSKLLLPTLQSLGAVGSLEVQGIQLVGEPPQPKVEVELGHVAAVVPIATSPVQTAAQTGVDQTAFAMTPLVDEPVLPFSGDAAPPPSGAPQLSEDDLAGATAFMAALEDLDDPIPFEQKPPELSLEQYASLCVERTLQPGRESEVAKRYQILTAQALHALDARWRQRFHNEGELFRRWQHAYAQYEAWVRSKG